MRRETTGGHDTIEQVAALVAEAKATDPFAPVTVVVASNYAALALRHALARRSIGGRTGVAHVAFLTLDQLAQQLAGPLDGPTLNPIVLAAAVRAALAADPASPFAPVAAHQATERAVVATYRELARAHPDTRAALAESPSPRTRAVLRVFEAVRARLAGYADDEQVVDRALAAVDAQRAAVGLVVVTPLDECSAGQQRLLDRLAATGPLVMLEFTFAAASTPLSRVLTAGDSDDEVRNVLRHVMALVDDGVPLHRIAIMFTAPEPYARIVREQLAAAGIPHTGPGIRRLVDSVTGRIVTGVLSLETEQLSRRSVVDLVQSSPLDVPATEFDRLSREAGVIGGAADWARKLQRFDDECAQELVDLEADDASAGRLARARRRRRDLALLAAFVSRRAAALDRARGLTSWAAAVAWLLDQLDELIGGATAPAGWPEREVVAHQAVRDALARLRSLDEIEAFTGFAGFADAATAALDEIVDRIGHFGEGLVFLPVALAAGLDLDAVFVVGAAEGLCPVTRREDALLPDADRARAVAGELPTRAARVARERQAFLHALATASRHRVVSYPRGDGRSGRARLPSRWVLALVEDQLGRTVASTELAGLDDPLVETRHSFLDGVRRAATPASVGDRDLRLLEHHQACGLDVARHHLAQLPDMRRSCELIAARRADVLTRFDGFVGRELSHRLSTGVLSPSRLERWAACPMRYFLGDVLRLSEVPKPDDALSMTALDRGTLLHTVLERFLGAQLQRSSLDYGELWPLAAEVFADFEARGLTGRPVLWQLARAQLVEHLARFAADDHGYRAACGARTDHVEFSFGFERPPIEIELDSGQRLRFRGRIDRVDRAGDTAVVFDYKSGKGGGVQRQLTADPVAAGRRLQLPIYAEAVRQRLGIAAVRAYYWFLGVDQPLAGIALDGTTAARTREVIGAIVEGVEDGVFPAFPDQWDSHFNTFDNCRHCDFDRLCPRDRDVTWEAKQSDEAVAVFLRLGADAGDAGDEGDEGDDAGDQGGDA